MGIFSGIGSGIRLSNKNVGKTAAPLVKTSGSQELVKARREAEKRFPFIKQFKEVNVAPAIVKNKGGLGEFEEPDSPNNPTPGKFTITIGEKSKTLQGGIADTIIADMVHAAGALSPQFQSLKKRLVNNLSEAELRLARRRFENDFRGRFSGSNFATFENFLNNFWVEGIVQHLLLPENSEIDEIRRQSPNAVPILDEMENLFRTGIRPPRGAK